MEKKYRIKEYRPEQKEYPQKLRDISKPPKALYVIGDLPMPDLPSVAIVGARNASAYGRSLAGHFAGVLVQNGVQVISGMARGIDTAAHKGALENDGRTYAVLGNGVDICYPKENKEVYHEIMHNGGVISEIWPGTEPLPAFFPMRNRIISAFADIVLVVEAREKSGSLITADQALEQGKDVYALPGRVTDQLSRGCNQLIMQGAGIACSPTDLLKALGINHENNIVKSEKNKFSLATKENSVYSCMSLQPKHINELSAESGIGIEEIYTVLWSLEQKGAVTEISKNYYITV